MNYFHKMKPVFVHVFFMFFPEYFSEEILSHYEEQDFSKVTLLKGPDLVSDHRWCECDIVGSE